MLPRLRLRPQWFALLATLAFASLSSAQVTFTEVPAGLTGVRSGSVAWGDYDSDGDLDILLSGLVRTDPNEWHTGVYRNDAGSFTDIDAGLDSVSSSSMAWGDYDNDGDLDILLTGARAGAYYTRLYRNDAGNFSDIGAGLADVGYSSVGWGDYDNDGDLDILLAGESDSGNISHVYRNDGGDVFAEIGAGLPGVSDGSAAWGDYDNDGDLDILLTGHSDSGNISHVYRNDGGDVFMEIGAGLTGVGTSSVAWGDYDNDGDLDILLTGGVAGGRLSRVCRNDGGDVFAEIDVGLPDVSVGSVAWGDCDNDGDLDILLTGRWWTGSEHVGISRVYRNDGGDVFADVGAGLPGVSYSSAGWGDYDNDGDLDILLTGHSDSGNISHVYRNDGGDVFMDIGAGLLGVANGSVAWGDYESDGDLDILLTGTFGVTPVSRVYRNDGGDVFAEIDAGLTGVGTSSVAWGDCDNDGDLDILLTGAVTGGRISRVYRNDGGDEFANIGAGLPGVSYSSAAWGDYDNDGDLDILLAGEADSGYVASVYQSNGAPANMPPCAPGNLSATWSAAGLMMSWNASTDVETPSAGLSYNLRVGTTPGGSEVLSAMADGVSGYRRVVQLGNAQQRTSWTLAVPPGTYYGSVQAVDGAYAGSGFAPEESLTSVALTDIGAGLPGVSASSVAWGDYDDDDDLDIVVSGWTGSQSVSRVCRNDAGIFTDIGAGLTGVAASAAAWGDYDNDGDLDLLLAGGTDEQCVSHLFALDVDPPRVPTGLPASVGVPRVARRSMAEGEPGDGCSLDRRQAGDSRSQGISRVYRNDAGRFADIGAGLLGVTNGDVAWGDYDNDGDLDVLLIGYTGSQIVSRVYRNDGGGVFTDIGAGLPGLWYSAAAWADYDNDGDLDLALTGWTGLQYHAGVYRNDAGAFTDIGAGLQGVCYGSVAWGDYDNDGDLDLLLAGRAGSTTYVATVYRNDAGSFTDIGAGLPEVQYATVAWADFDNDGWLDILLTGWTGSLAIWRVYRNTGGSFVDYFGPSLAGVYCGSAAWGDYDNDGDLDLLLTGDTGSGYVANVYQSDHAPANAPPNAPANLTATFALDHQLTLSWDAATDPETPSDGLSYNLRVGTTPGGSDIVSPMADGTSGYRRVVQLGNAQQRMSWTLTAPPGVYYWSVQALDGGYTGSAFAPEESYEAIEHFTKIGAGLTGVRSGSVAWGDYDSDGDLDILLSGFVRTDPNEWHTGVYRNDDGSFTDIHAGLESVSSSSMAWGDYDNDGDLDILLTGARAGGYYTRVYRNDAGSFGDIGAGLMDVGYSSVGWGDYDNDGDLDILLTGASSSGDVSRVYRNDGGDVFAEIGAGLTGVGTSSVAWGDYDNDGDLDILLTGGVSGGPLSIVYRNDGGDVFAEIDPDFPDVSVGSVGWGDYDNDGDLDILLAGESDSGDTSSVYRNDGGDVFAEIGAGLPGVSEGSAAWGDYDNDGDLDILLTGNTGTEYVSRVYRNEAGDAFTDVGAGLPGVSMSSVAWGDYDSDSDLDILLTGDTGSGYASHVYRNNCPRANTAPVAPANLSAQVIGSTMMFTWDEATDAETPSLGLTYNLRVGTTTGGGEICPAMADAGTGYRRIPSLGNTNHNTNWRIELPDPPAPVYYWSVQALDACFAGSAFGPEQALNDPATGAPDLHVLPTVYALHPGAPNPFGWRTTLRFDLPRAGRTRMEIFDVTGRRVRVLVDGRMEPGWYAPVWDGRDKRGRPVSSGVYFVRLQAGDFRATEKVVRTR